MTPSTTKQAFSSLPSFPLQNNILCYICTSTSRPLQSINIHTYEPSTKTSVTRKDNCSTPHSVLVFLNPQHPRFQSSTKVLVTHNRISQKYKWLFLPSLATIWKSNETQKRNRVVKQTDLRERTANPRRERGCERISVCLIERKERW